MRIKDIVAHLSTYSIRRYNELPAMYLLDVTSSKCKEDFSDILSMMWVTGEGRNMYVSFKLYEEDLTYRFLRTLRRDLRCATYAHEEVGYESTR